MRIGKVFGLAAVILVAAGGAALAQSSLGIGSNEPVVQPGGMFSGFFQWIATEQREFYRSMTEALKEMRDNGSAAWLLIGLSFAYGVFHAAGPGHGKVVISSYMIANETALKRGIFLSFASSFVQALSAILLVGVAYLFLRGTSVSMTDAATFFEIASYALIALFGAWLLVSKIRARRAVKGHAHAHAHHGHAHHHHDHGEGEVCASCGHAHMPGAAEVAKIDGWRSALAAILSVGIRPCSGAVIVLSFALLNGLVAGGVLSVFAMALGTAITVSALATLAVTAKNTALKVSGSTAMSSTLHFGIEAGAASLLMLMGVLLFAGAVFG